MKTEITEAEIQAFLEDPRTRSIASETCTDDSPLDVQSNDEIVRIYDYCGWEEYYNHADFMALVAKHGKFAGVESIVVLNEITELEQVDEFR